MAMVDTDWREILNFSQKELKQADKDKLCESLSWMEADDIELNFSDLKSLFKLAQDILKLKNEQVNNLLGRLEASKRKKGKTNHNESPYTTKSEGDFLSKGSEDFSQTMQNQEKIIKANKEVLDQLSSEIAELEKRKNKLQDERVSLDRESESSRDPVSEMNELAQLEHENAMKNRHIRKLLTDVTVLEEENTKLKQKVSILKDKLSEATQIIENLTEKMYKMNNECTQLKEILGNSERIKAQFSIENETLKRELTEKELEKEKMSKELQSKIQHWKNIVRSKKTEFEALATENTKLKEVIQSSKSTPKDSYSDPEWKGTFYPGIPTGTPKLPRVKPQGAASTVQSDLNKKKVDNCKLVELQTKLVEATNEILQSANIIEALKRDNKILSDSMDRIQDYSAESEKNKNQSDDGKERAIIIKLRNKLRSLTVALENAEETIDLREKELSETTSQLQVLKTDEGINSLVESLKNNKKQLKLKNEEIKSLVQELNAVNQLFDDLQLENEAMRQQLNIKPNEKISARGILKKYHNLDKSNLEMSKKLNKFENELVYSKLENYNNNLKISKLTKLLIELGYEDKLNDNSEDVDTKPFPENGKNSVQKADGTESFRNYEAQAIFEENEGLRKGLQEILNFLKDSNSVTSGTLALQCPSLEAVLQSMEARHAAGWFAPHMSTVMELRAALGGKDALLTALHETRKETFEVMAKLTEESTKSLVLQQKLNELQSENQSKNKNEEMSSKDVEIGEFGTWMIEDEQDNIDLFEKSEIEKIITKGNSVYDNQIKIALQYFHNKFKNIFDKMTALVIQTSDDQNKWSIQEEQYKAQIENLKTQLSKYNVEELSDSCSEGLVPTTHFLVRKCSYLEESYKQIRTLNCDLKNEYFELKRETMIRTSEYESQIQTLILKITDLTDKLRNAISIELFWKQNETFNDFVTKYRKLVNNGVLMHERPQDLLKYLESDKMEIINNLRQHSSDKTHQNIPEEMKTILTNVETTVYQKQLERVCIELEDKFMRIRELELKNVQLQESLAKLIDGTLASTNNEEVVQMKEQLKVLTEENKILKEQCQHIHSQLDTTLSQLRDNQHKQMSGELEINMLRHQILDLQSTGDNKAIIARLSSEVLLAHLQASEAYRNIEKLSLALNKEKQLKVESEEMLKARQKVFDVYAYKYESKFRYIYEVLQTLRLQYQGAIPLSSLENYLNNIEEYQRKKITMSERLDEIEDLRSSLMTKHLIYDQILDDSKNKCWDSGDNCPHLLKCIIMQKMHSREIVFLKEKILALEHSREEISKQSHCLERSLILVNQGFENTSAVDVTVDNKQERYYEKVPDLKLEDMSDDEQSSRRSKTITLPKPKILKPPEIECFDTTKHQEQVVDYLPGSPEKVALPQNPVELKNVFVQTMTVESRKKSELTQTDADSEISVLKKQNEILRKNHDSKSKELSEYISLAQKKDIDIDNLIKEKNSLESTVNFFKDKDININRIHDTLQAEIRELRTQISKSKNDQLEKTRITEVVNEENKSLLLALKQLESENNSIVAEYKELLKNERDEYLESTKKFNSKIMQLKKELDTRSTETNSSTDEVTKENVRKYSLKIVELEDKCFKLQSELDDCKTELATYKSELNRWKNLASERLSKMEQLNSQFEERHCQEVESYKAENQHWLSQLNDTQREHLELRSRLTEQKSMHTKQLAEKDSIIEHLRSVVNNLKSQMINMQTLISVNDPNFDLSAIVEVDETSDVNSHQGLERLELKFDSTIDLHEPPEDMLRIPATSTAIWQEPTVERLRREKQFANKQNTILRRQIKALAAREKRARLDAQNLKNQVFRISTSGNSRSTTAETTALHSKIASLQAQLTSARRDSSSTVALWDKWKRAQQSAERWQARYEEKCAEVKKLEANLDLAKSAISRLEREKRILLSKLSEVKNEKLLAIEKQDSEVSEKGDQIQVSSRRSQSVDEGITERALIERVVAQQRRIAALHAAEKGNEVLVSEYEKSLAEITALKGQILKLESTLLESQIRSPLNNAHDSQPELEYWKRYCEMLKDENVQLSMRVRAHEAHVPAPSAHRVNDLEQTVLTLRGLVSKLQAEQKTSGVYKRVDSRPSSGRSATDKGRNQLEAYRTEITNLKRSILEKDHLLERSKEMLKIAAEREDQLLRENAALRHRLDNVTKSASGFSSA